MFPFVTQDALMKNKHSAFKLPTKFYKKQNYGDYKINNQPYLTQKLFQPNDKIKQGIPE